jgi:hypothetical protein
MIKLSNTAVDKYLACPKAYYIHYMLKLRPKVVGSALPFGSAIDEGLNSLLKGKTLEESYKLFCEKWDNFEINKKMVEGKSTDKIKYYKSDIDESLFDDNETCTPHESIKRKALFFLTDYQKEILPNIKEVMGIQVPIQIKNTEGDQIIGFIDFIAKWKNDKVIIFDNKTSSRKYEEDKIEKEGKQLALYFEGCPYKADEVGYIVIEKVLRKKDPRVRIQVLTGLPSKELTQKTIDNFDTVLYNIKNGNFQSNHPNCETFGGEECTCQLFEREGYKAFDYVGE